MNYGLPKPVPAGRYSTRKLEGEEYTIPWLDDYEKLSPTALDDLGREVLKRDGRALRTVCYAVKRWGGSLSHPVSLGIVTHDYKKWGRPAPSDRPPRR